MGRASNDVIDGEEGRGRLHGTVYKQAVGFRRCKVACTCIQRTAGVSVTYIYGVQATKHGLCVRACALRMRRHAARTVHNASRFACVCVWRRIFTIAIVWRLPSHSAWHHPGVHRACSSSICQRGSTNRRGRFNFSSPLHAPPGCFIYWGSVAPRITEKKRNTQDRRTGSSIRHVPCTEV